MSSSPSEPAPGRRPPRGLPSLVVMLLLLGWYGGSAWLAPTRRAIGSAWSEAPGHLWGLWATAAGLFEHGPLLRVAPGLGFPDGFEAHLVDPIDLLLFLPGYLLGGGGPSGAVLGWNLLHAGAIVVGGLGCVALTRALTGDARGTAWSAAVLTAAFCGGAFLLSHPHMGRSEYLPAVLMPAQLALMLRWVRGTGGWGCGVGAGLLLGGVALGGSYLAIFALLLVLPLAVALPISARRDWKRTTVRLALVGGVALLVAVPMVAALALYPPPGGSPLLSAPPRPMPEADMGTLLTMLRLGPLPDLEPLLDQPPYPGVALLLLAVAGAVLRPRKATGWLLLGLWLAVLSLGPALATQHDGQSAVIRLPAGWLMAIAPPLANLKAWSRLGVLLPLPLGIAALYGCQALMARTGRSWQRAALGIVLVLLILADQGSWPRRSGLDRPIFEPGAPADLLQLLEVQPPGAIVQLPLEVSIGKGIKLQAARSHLWQLEHDRAMTATPGVISDTSLRWSAIARLAVNRQFSDAGRGVRPGQPPLPGAQGDLNPAQLACARADAAALHARGISTLVLLADEPAGPALKSLLEPILGPATTTQGNILAWDLTTWADNDAESCSLPPVPAKVHMMLNADRGEARKLEAPAGLAGPGPWASVGGPARVGPARKPAGP